MTGLSSVDDEELSKSLILHYDLLEKIFFNSPVKFIGIKDTNNVLLFL